MKNENLTFRKIGIIGEHPQNDANAMITLLDRYKQSNIHFECVDVKNFRGSAMDNHTFAGVLASQLIGEDFEYIIVLRDLDFVKDKIKKETDRIKDKEKWFVKVNTAIGNIGVFFLIIYELEALLLCDLNTLEQYFEVKIPFSNLPIKEKNPKDFLQNATQNSKEGRYEEKNASLIFRQINFSKLYQNHQGKRSFQTLADDLLQRKIILHYEK